MQIISVLISVIIFLAMLFYLGISIYQKILEIKTKKNNKKGGD